MKYPKEEFNEEYKKFKIYQFYLLRENKLKRVLNLPTKPIEIINNKLLEILRKSFDIMHYVGELHPDDKGEILYRTIRDFNDFYNPKKHTPDAYLYIMTILKYNLK